MSRAATIKFPHKVIIRAPGLLPMLYKTREIAEDLGIKVELIKKWVKMGMPYIRNNQGHLWINGEEFAEWVEEKRKARKENKMALDEAYCLRCRKAVKFEKLSRTVNSKQVLLSGKCPECGGVINKGGRNG